MLKFLLLSNEKKEDSIWQKNVTFKNDSFIFQIQKSPKNNCNWLKSIFQEDSLQ